MEAVNLTIAITGASGAVLCREALRALEADARVVRVIAEELGISGRTGLLEKLLGSAPAKITQHSDTEIGAAIASGSYPSNGMIVLPCSMGTLATIANGLANSLIARAAEAGRERGHGLCRPQLHADLAEGAGAAEVSEAVFSLCRGRCRVGVGFMLRWGVGTVGGGCP